jgi:hypothetical protein
LDPFLISVDPVLAGGHFERLFLKYIGTKKGDDGRT